MTGEAPFKPEIRAARSDATRVPPLAAFPLSYAFHVIEEAWGGETFPVWASRLSGTSFTREEFIVLNGAAFAAMCLAVAAASQWPRARCIVVPTLGTIVAGNGALHVVASLWSGTYSPGVVSGVLLWLPLGAWTLWWAGRTPLALSIGVPSFLLVMLVARRGLPCVADPLFRPLDADDGQADFTLLRTRALFKVRVALPARFQLTDDPTATHVTVSRAVPPLSMLKHTAPYQQDRSTPTLESQALAAVNQHMEPTRPPTQEFLETVAAFQQHLFSSKKVRALSRAIDAGRPLPDIDPPLTPTERLGKEKFDNFCGRCHGGPAPVRNLEDRMFPPFDGSTNPVSINVVVSNPPPAGFPSSPIHGPGFDLPTQRFTATLPSGSHVILTSSDPGTVLTDVRALDTVGGNQVFHRFDIPQLRGINGTAPYFHDLPRRRSRM